MLYLTKKRCDADELNENFFELVNHAVLNSTMKPRIVLEDTNRIDTES